jgi:hypothetical protein
MQREQKGRASKAKDYSKISIQKIRSYPGCETLNDDEALEAIQAVERITALIYQVYKHQKQTQL